MTPTPLRAFTVLETADASTARAALLDTYGARTFELRGKDKFSVKAGFVQIGGISLSYCDYSAPVSLSFPEALFARQHICLSGHASIETSGQDQHLTTKEWSGFVAPGTNVKYRYEADTRQLVMWLDLQRLSRKLDALLGNDRCKPIEWPARGNSRQDAVNAMRRAVEFLVGELDEVGSSPRATTEFVEIEDFIMVRFLYAHDHDRLLQLTQGPRAASNSQLRRLEDYISEKWREPLDVETMANVSGVSARSVFRYFRSAYGCTPQAYRKRIRLEHAKRMLGRKEPGTTVMGIALSCGFQSFGHFARDYKALFGELPSATLLDTSSSDRHVV